MFKIPVKVRKLVKQRLAAAAEEIFELLEITIREYEEETRAQLYGPGGALSVGATDTVLQLPHIVEEENEESFITAQLLTSEDTALPSGQSFIDNNYNVEDNSSPSEVSNLQTYLKHYLTSGAAPLLPPTDEPAEEPGPSFENPDFSVNPLNSSYRPCKCPVCEQTFLTEEELDQHMSSHMCAMTYDELLFLHQASAVQVGHAKKRIKKPFSCSLCGFKFSQKRFLESHMLMHKAANRAGTKPFKCSLCKRAFYNKNRFKRHVLQHSQQQTEGAEQSKKSEYKCTVCGRVFAYQMRLLKHTVIHEKDGKGLTSTSQKETHKTHVERNMPFSCSVCGQGFYTERLLARHKSRHPELTTSKPQTERCCTECGKVYNNRASLVKHMEMHKIQVSSSCLFCGATFEAEEDLQEHMARHMPLTGVTEETGTQTFQFQCGKEEPEAACSGKDMLENSSPKSQET